MSKEERRKTIDAAWDEIEVQEGIKTFPLAQGMLPPPAPLLCTFLPQVNQVQTMNQPLQALPNSSTPRPLRV